MYLFFRFLLSIYLKRKFKFHIHNKEKLPAPKTSKKGGFIIACNHQFYWDPPVITALMPGRYSFMAKSELFKNKLFAWLIRRCGAFPVVRGGDNTASIERALSDIKKGRIFVIFPEGTRSKDGTIGRGKSGAVLIAAQAGVPILPVCLMYGIGGEKKRIDYAVGDFIPVSELRVDGQDRQEIKRISERVMGALKDLQKQILDSDDNS